MKFLFPINKQFSFDSFLDWEGHYWVSGSFPLDHSTALINDIFSIVFAKISYQALDQPIFKFVASWEKDEKSLLQKKV